MFCFYMWLELLDIFFMENINFKRGFIEFGGFKGKIYGGFLFICEMVVFLLVGNYVGYCLEVMCLFWVEYLLIVEGVLEFIIVD